MGEPDMAYTKDKFNQEVSDVRARMKAVRDNAKAEGMPNTRFYQELLYRMAPYGVHASLSWLREQCDPDNTTPPSLRKLFALKQALDEYQRNTGLSADVRGDKGEGRETAQHVPRTAEHDEVEDARLTENLELVGKIAIENPARAIRIAAKLLNSDIDKHVKAGGGVMVFLEYLRARISFSHDLTLSNMPLHTIRDVRTKADAEAINPSFKTLAAVLYTLSAIEAAYDTFPWGSDAALNETIYDIRAQQEKAKAKKKTPSIAQQNRALMNKIVGITVIKPKATQRS